MRPTGIPFLLLFIPSPLPGQQVFSLEKEAALGQGLAADYRLRAAPSVDDHTLRDYVAKVAARLNQFARSPFSFTVEIFEGPGDAKPGAAGLPGGYLFVSRRLLAEALDEAGFARPVAHAIAHVSARLGTRPASRGTVEGVSTIPLIFVGGWPHDLARAPMSIPPGFRKFREEQEAEADRLAAEWMAQSGFAGSTFETGEFVAMRERALALAPPPPRAPEPPSLRKRHP